MGYKNYAQQKAVWADKKDGGKGHPDKKKGSPAKAHGGPHLGEGHDINKRMQFDPANRKRVDEMPQNVKDSLTAAAWEYGGPFYSPKFQVNVDPEDGVLYNRPIYSDGTMLTYPSLDKPVKRETELNKPPTPLNHCASDMMHSGGWQEMRKHNSPGTIGNEAGIKHNKKMRKEIGTFNMPHSPLNKNNDFDIDYSGAKPVDLGNIPASNFTKAKKKLVEGYGGADNPEYQMEKGAYFYDKKKDKMRSSYLEYPEDAAGVDERYLGKNWDNKSPLNKEGKKDACYHKVKSRVKVWPSAYASGQLVQCRKAGAANWGEKSKKKK